MKRFPPCIAAALAAAALVPQVQAVSIRVTGIEGELLANAEAYLRALAVGEAETVAAVSRRAVRKAVANSLQPYGYYSPDIQVKSDRETQTVHVAVYPGEPVRIARTNVTITGEAADDEDFKKHLAKVPAEGDQLSHPAYDSFKSGLSSLSLAKGYFDADLKESSLGVAPSIARAVWTIDFDSGRRYKYGPVTFKGSQIEERFLYSLVPFKQGEPFTAARLTKLGDLLNQTGWFRSAVVTMDREAAEDYEVPIIAQVSPRVENSVEVGAGVATDIGPHVKGSWKKPWINSRGHSITMSADIASVWQKLDFSYQIPLEKNPLSEYYLFSAGYDRDDYNDTLSNGAFVKGARCWKLDNGWQRVISLTASVDDFTQGGVDNTTKLLYPGVSFSRTRRRGGALPTWGDSQSYSLEYANEAWGSDIDLLILKANGVLVRTFGKHRFVGRAGIGILFTKDFDKVPPDLRFFAGGDRSIRGYGYKDISPVDSNGEQTGAKKMITGSIEYQYNISGNWWGAVFVDGGEAVRSFSDSDWKKGAGVGIRWVSPVGPVKLDIARPVGDSKESGYEFYIGLGAEI